MQKKENLFIVLLLFILLGVGFANNYNAINDGTFGEKSELFSTQLTVINQKSIDLQVLPDHRSLNITSNADFASHPNITGSGTASDP